MDIDHALTVFAIVATNLGTVLALYINLDKKLEENRKETNSILHGIHGEINAIQAEMKDFHGRLERIDAEFKGKMALQDAEFKAHLKNDHKQ